MSSMEDCEFVDGQGRHLKTYSWAPSGEVRGVVIVCHGYGEHLSPYYNALVEQGNVADADGSTAVHHRKVGNHY